MRLGDIMGHEVMVPEVFLKLIRKSCMTKVGAALSIPGTSVAQLRTGTRETQSPPESLRTLLA